MTERVFLGFPSIESFQHVRIRVSKYPQYAAKPVQYKGKIKLHGTNAGVRVVNGEVIAQSRNEFLGNNGDNHGFGRWVEKNKEFFLNIAKRVNLDDFIIFGEWAGLGIQKKTALNMLDKKFFAVFLISTGQTSYVENTTGETHYAIDNLIIEPKEIEDFIGAERPDDVYILPWTHECEPIDFMKIDTIEKMVGEINSLIEQVEKVDPWVKETFGVEGIGEGIVYYPVGATDYWTFRSLTFKAKGEKHKVNRTDKQAVQIDPTVYAQVVDFVTAFATEARFEQAISEVCKDYPELEEMGKFLKWVNKDIEKESVAEREASNLDWKMISKFTTNAARLWYINKVNNRFNDAT